MEFLEVRLEEQEQNRTAVADIALEDLTSPHTIGELKSELLELINRERPDLLIVDWSRVRRAGTDSFGIMLVVKRRMAEWKGLLRLCGMNPLLSDGFAQCGLGKLIPLFVNAESARAGGGQIG